MTFTERFAVTQKKKDEKMKKLKDKYGTKVDLEEEAALAIRDAKSGKKETAESILARQ